MQGRVTGVNREKGMITVRSAQGTSLTILEWCEGISQGDALEWRSSGVGRQTYRNISTGEDVVVTVRKHDAFQADLL